MRIKFNDEEKLRWWCKVNQFIPNFVISDKIEKKLYLESDNK